MNVAGLWRELQRHTLYTAIQEISVHVGGDPDHPETVVKAAESLRDALCRAKGHAGIPRTVLGVPVPYNEVGR